MTEVEEKLVDARVNMLLQQPFWGTLAIRLTLVDLTDQIPTAATDGRCFYYNRDFINKLDKQELVFLFAHEVSHCMYMHMSTRGSRLPKLWNAANDFVINLELAENHVGKLPTKKSCGIEICYDKKYAGLGSMEVYELLLKDPDAHFPEFDVHFEAGNGPGGKLDDEEQAILRNEIAGAVMQAAKASPRNVPNSVKRLLKDLTEPQMNWRQMLHATIQSIVRNDFTWDRCSRKTQSSGIYLPSMKDDFKIEVGCGIDVSGSMTTEMIRDQLSEVKGIIEQFADFKLYLWCFDTRVYNFVEYTPENIDEINEYQIEGGGGTDFECNWTFMKERELRPERLVIMTDGYNSSSDWGDEDWAETIFLIHSNPSHSIVAPFGITCYYDEIGK